MKIASIRVQNFRSIKDQTITCDRLLGLVGRNGTGKSAILRALQLFYSPTPTVSLDDFYSRDPDLEIVISIVFDHLCDAALAQFDKYMRGDRLSIERVFKDADGSISTSLHGFSLQHALFSPIRIGLEIKDRGMTARTAYDNLRLQENYATLPAWTTLAAVEPALQQWEVDHPDDCTPTRDSGKFFGFQQVGHGYLGHFTRFLYVPAVRNASEDAAEGRNSIFSELMDLVVRSVLSQRGELADLQASTQQQYEDVFSPDRLAELQVLGATLTSTLQIFVPQSAISLNWLPLSRISLPLPQAEARLIEDDFESEVERVGHGLQRAYIITMLQHLTLAQSTTPAVDNESDPDPDEPTYEHVVPDLILAIEEPEMYQHPSRQRHFATILSDLATGDIPGVSHSMQVFYTTHSPLFVQLDQFHNIRVTRKSISDPELPAQTAVFAPDISAILDELWRAEGQPPERFTEAGLFARLHTTMTPWMNEGFFSEVVVLVEGETDRAALIGMAQQLQIPLESRGISIIPCRGKTNLHGPAAIFRHFGIPVYLLWDGDSGDPDANPSDNHRLLRLCGASIEDWPDAIDANWGCFKVDLETTLRTEIGADIFDVAELAARTQYGFKKKKHALKNPHVIAAILKTAATHSRDCQSLQRVVQAVNSLISP